MPSINVQAMSIKTPKNSVLKKLFFQLIFCLRKSIRYFWSNMTLKSGKNHYYSHFLTPSVCKHSVAGNKTGDKIVGRKSSNKTLIKEFNPIFLKDIEFENRETSMLKAIFGIFDRYEIDASRQTVKTMTE